MTISVIGLNHKSANIDIREKFAFSPDNASLLLRRIKRKIIFMKFWWCQHATERKFIQIVNQVLETSKDG